MGCVVFGGLTDDNTRSESGYHGETETEPVLDAQHVKNTECGTGNEQSRYIGSKSQRMKKVAHSGSFLSAYEEDTENAEEYTHSSNEHRSNYGLKLNFEASGSKSHSTESGSGENGAAI